MARGTRATPENRGAEAAAQYRDGREAGGRRPQGRRPAHVLQVEDYLLAGWILLVEYGLRRMAGDADGALNPFVLRMMLMDDPGGPTGNGWLGWLASLTPAGWALLVLFLFILLTRGPLDTDRDVALHRRTPMLALALPLLSIYALIASGIQQAIFGSPDLEPGQQPPWPGPYTPGPVRRTVAVPLSLLGDAMFRSELQQTPLLSYSPSSFADSLSPSLVLLLIASAFPFMIFVAGPRIAAGAEMAWRPWILRFALFFATTWFGAAAIGW